MLWRIIFQVISNISMLTTRAKKKIKHVDCRHTASSGDVKGKILRLLLQQGEPEYFLDPDPAAKVNQAQQVHLYIRSEPVNHP